MRWALALTLVLAGCGDGSGTDAGAPADGATGDGAAADSGNGDSGTSGDGGPSCVGSEPFFDLGHCFEAQTCCTAADCGTDRSWICNTEGSCEEDARTCGCVDDLDCTDGSFCFTNAVVCGVCMPARDVCAGDPTCPTGDCVDGYCTDETMCTAYPEL